MDCFRISCLFLFVLYGAVLSETQNTISGCQAYNPQEASITSPLCAPFISSQIFVPYQIDGIQPILDQRLNESSYWLIEIVKDVIPQDCYQHLMGIMCQAAFPTCAQVDVSGTTYDVPAYPCKSVCESALAICGPILSHVSGFALNCSMPNALGGGDQWPTGPEFDFSVDGTTVPAQCSTLVFPPNASIDFSLPPVASCPSFLAPMKNPKGGDAVCSLMCPDPSYTHDEWDIIRRMVLSMAIISFVLQIFLIISHVILRSRRKFPPRIHVNLCICALGLSIAFLIGGRDPFHTTLCNGPSDYSKQDTNMRCTMQALVLVYFGFTSCGWAFILSLMAFIMVVYEVRPKMLVKYEKYFHLGVWLAPIPFIASLLLKTSISFEKGGLSFCTAIMDVTRKVSYDLMLFYIPVSIILAGVVILFSCVVFKLITFRLLHRGSQVDTFKAQRHLFISILIVLVIFALIFVLRYSTNIRAISDGTTDWITCKVLSELGLMSNDECSTNTNPHRQSFSLVVLQNFATSSVGFWVFIGCGRQLDLYRTWGVIIGHMRRGEFKEIGELIKYGPKKRKRTISSENGSSRSSKPSQTEKKETEMKETKVASPTITLNTSAVNTEVDMTGTEITPRSDGDEDNLRSDVGSDTEEV